MASRPAWAALRAPQPATQRPRSLSRAPEPEPCFSGQRSPSTQPRTGDPRTNPGSQTAVAASLGRAGPGRAERNRPGRPPLSQGPVGSGAKVPLAGRRGLRAPSSPPPPRQARRMSGQALRGRREGREPACMGRAESCLDCSEAPRRHALRRPGKTRHRRLASSCREGSRGLRASLEDKAWGLSFGPLPRGKGGRPSPASGPKAFHSPALGLRSDPSASPALPWEGNKHNRRALRRRPGKGGQVSGSSPPCKTPQLGRRLEAALFLEGARHTSRRSLALLAASPRRALATRPHLASPPRTFLHGQSSAEGQAKP